jgi:mannose-6-phosphate isomerase-like protein (cupin superfamily)
MKPISITNAEHYTWPSTTWTSVANPDSISEHLCDGWHLHRSESLSVIEERMPPNSVEQRHMHQRRTQFFYVLTGELTIELDGKEHPLTPGTGLTVPAQTPHQVLNRGREDARFLVISQPPSHDDRVPVASE